MSAVNLAKSPEFEEALEAASRESGAPQPLCHGRPAEFVDFDEPPTEADTRALCAPCPLLAICKESARKHQAPDWGIQGGIAWLGGKQYHWLERFGLLPGDS